MRMAPYLKDLIIVEHDGVDSTQLLEQHKTKGDEEWFAIARGEKLTDTSPAISKLSFLLGFL